MMQLVAKCNDGSAKVSELESLYEHDKEITCKVFFKHVSLEEVSEYLGYAFGRTRGLHIKDDWAIQFFRSKFRGKLCYHIDWSSIDHIYQ